MHYRYVAGHVDVAEDGTLLTYGIEITDPDQRLIDNGYVIPLEDDEAQAPEAPPEAPAAPAPEVPEAPAPEAPPAEVSAPEAPAENTDVKEPEADAAGN